MDKKGNTKKTEERTIETIPVIEISNAYTLFGQKSLIEESLKYLHNSYGKPVYSNFMPGDEFEYSFRRIPEEGKINEYTTGEDKILFVDINNIISLVGSKQYASVISLLEDAKFSEELKFIENGNQLEKEPLAILGDLSDRMQTIILKMEERYSPARKLYITKGVESSYNSSDRSIWEDVCSIKAIMKTIEELGAKLYLFT
jgi:hypothetical protein